MNVGLYDDAGDMPVATLLDQVRTEPAAPAGGSVACFAVAMAAALLEMAARQSRPASDESRGAVAQAASFRRAALRLALEDAEAFATADAALRDPAGADQEERDAAIGTALDRAAAVPLRISEVAADVVQLGAVVVVLAPGDRRADVATAVLLGEAACLAAAHLVEVNLTTTAGDDRLSQARDASRRAQEARARGLETSC